MLKKQLTVRDRVKDSTVIERASRQSHYPTGNSEVMQDVRLLFHTLLFSTICRCLKPVTCHFLDIALEAKISKTSSSSLQFFKSAAACELVIICKVVNILTTC